MIAKFLFAILGISAVDSEPKIKNVQELINLAKNSFPINEDHINQIKSMWEIKCSDAKKGDLSDPKENSFIVTKIDMDKVKNTRIKEKTEILSIDVGGSSLKICIVELCPKKGRAKRCQLKCENVKLYAYKDEKDPKPLNKMEWNDWVASRVSRYIKLYKLEDKTPKIASLTFSYPINGDSITECQVSEIGKNWNFSKEDYKNKDIIKTLNTSLSNKGVDSKIFIALNDVIATYMAGCMYSNTQNIAAILGTGTNGGFCLEEGNLINSEWAKANVPKDIYSEADKIVMKNLKIEGVEFCDFELLSAGFKFLDLIKAQMEIILGDCEQEYLKTISIARINEVFYDEKRNNIDLDEVLYNVVLNFKIRAYKMIAALIIASSKNIKSSKFSIITNGAAFDKVRDRKLFKKVLNDLKSNPSDLPQDKIQFKVIHYDQASLAGCAYTAYCYSEQSLLK